MEINNCEEYVLCELHFAKEKIKEYELIIENQKAELNRVVGKKESSTTINIDRSSGVYYRYSITSTYYMEDLLKKLFSKDFTLDEAKSCLIDDDKLKELMKKQECQYDRENEVMEKNYQILLTYAGREYAIYIDKDNYDIYLLDDKTYYHEDKKSLAETNMIAEFKENLKKYIEREEKKDGSK